MSTIQSSLISSFVPLDQRAKQQDQTAGASSFEALLLSMSTGSGSSTGNSAADILGVSNGNSISGLVDSIFESMTRPQASDAGAATSTPNKYPFSPAFESTFGLGGPLPNYITMITAKLKLTAEQNQALQDISIKNKDIVKTPDSVQKVAQELEMAGIGYR